VPHRQWLFVNDLLWQHGDMYEGDDVCATTFGSSVQCQIQELVAEMIAGIVRHGGWDAGAVERLDQPSLLGPCRTICGWPSIYDRHIAERISMPVGRAEITQVGRIPFQRDLVAAWRLSE